MAEESTATGNTGSAQELVPEPVEELWLDVSNVKFKGDTVEVQLRADREPDRPRWWPVSPPLGSDRFKAVIEALDKKRPVMAKLVCNGGGLKVTDISIQYAETTVVR